MATESKRAELKIKLDQITPSHFEHFVAECFAAAGWETTVTQESQDQGIDVIAEKTEPIYERIAIQVKHRDPDGSSLGAPEIREYQGLIQQGQGADTVIVATNIEFSSNAKSLAYDNQRLKLVGRTDLVDLA